MSAALQIFASAMLKVFADAFLGWMRDAQTARDEQALGAQKAETAAYADAAQRADRIAGIAADTPDHAAVAQRLSGGNF